MTTKGKETQEARTVLDGEFPPLAERWCDKKKTSEEECHGALIQEGDIFYTLGKASQSKAKTNGKVMMAKRTSMGNSPEDSSGEIAAADIIAS